MTSRFLWPKRGCTDVHMIICGHTWSCMIIYDHAWLSYTIICDQISYMITCDHMWWYIIYEHIWPNMVIHDPIWPCDFSGRIWSYMITYGHERSHMILYDHARSHMVIYNKMLSHMITSEYIRWHRMYDHIWWYLSDRT